MRRVVFVCGFTLLVAMGWSLSAVAFPDPIGDCIGSGCPSEPYPNPNNGDFIGTDEALNVFVGGSMNVVSSAAESEGKLVVLGNLDVSKSSAGSYNIGVVGAGSRITPPNDSDHAVIGGDITVEDSPLSTIHLGGSDSDETRWGNLAYGGDTTISQGDRLDLTPNGQLIDGGPTVTDPYASLRGTITGISNCAATYTATGTVNVQFGTATFTGDGASMLQVFNVPGDIGTSSENVSIDLVGVPEGATVVINMLDTDPGVFLNVALLLSVTPEYTRLVWNFPNAATATIGGSAQVPGSILVGPTTSTTTITSPGTNGRVLLAGNLVHGGGTASGQEMHAYPFKGTLPPCEPAEDVDTPADVADTDTDADTDTAADADADLPADVADFGTDTESDVDTDLPADVADLGTDTESDVDTDQPADVADLGTDTESDVDTDQPADVADLGTDTESDVDTDQPADVADLGTDTESDVDTDQPADVADFGTDTESDVDTDQPADVADLGADTDGDADTDDAADDSDGGEVDPEEGEALPDTGADRYAPLIAALGAASLLAGTAITRRARRPLPTHRA
ncbi:choice-of-anchor A domain-containing protein [Aeromicrobium panaciterrae]|uniref:Choice-of-anchor A domain-containing protein n=1 Tax=Aeromicrobium panaciterrae TaxID=363861 RepID=A0ABU1UQ10_9ACTN|nr:choice-of-anchor A family protein [Aeromicrobium panaciterrae]MDR7087235.1 choice-of-anchor A domain-containing protein [Aeromicrobium panaciterrae]